jgi:hypothetical protein
LAYYVENKDSLKSVAIDPGEGCVQPSLETAKNGSYQPLSRPLFVYVSKGAAAVAHVQAFIDFYLTARVSWWVTCHCLGQPMNRPPRISRIVSLARSSPAAIYKARALKNYLQLEKRH